MSLFDKMKKNQLTRALRVDKLTICALEATLRMYLDEEKAIKEIRSITTAICLMLIEAYIILIEFMKLIPS